MYGLARDLKEALFDRQPKVLLVLPPFSTFIFFLESFLHDLFPLLVFPCLYMFTLKGNVESNHGGWLFCDI